MDFLIDSHALIWYLNGDAQLSVNAHSTISNQNNRRWISPASIWEIAIKVNLGKLNLNRPLPDIQVSLSTDGFLWLPIEFKHAIQAGNLPPHHRDPFDRMLIAQALAEGMAIVTKDPGFPIYGVKTLW
ncbi:MAG: type II toxin-antitoxin system VapC family toxin [Saprospiraceae bacterium]|nr:type II toxin-antitoxin system VapC family toxin [Saprospiraceae bacterium]